MAPIEVGVGVDLDVGEERDAEEAPVVVVEGHE